MDWTLFARYAAPVATLFIGAALNRYLERRPKLIAFLSHAAAVSVQPPNGQAFSVHTHAVVVRNTGGKSATNIRLGHAVLPNFSVYPQIAYTVSPLPLGGQEIVFPTLVPGEQVAVNYLYVPPLIWSEVNTHIKSDEGLAKILNVLPTPQASPWLTRLAAFLMLIGAVTTLVAVVELVRRLAHVLHGA